MHRLFRVAFWCWLLVGTAHVASHAAPTSGPPILTNYTELLAAAQQAQQRATSETNPALQAELWQQAALHFAAIIKLGPTITAIQRCSAGTDMMLAIRSTLRAEPSEQVKGAYLDALNASPQPLPEMVRQRVAMLLLYDTLDQCRQTAASGATANDPKVDALFLRAQLLRAHLHDNEAIVPLRTIVDQHPGHATAGFALELLLDLYNRTGQFDELTALAQRTLASPARITVPKDTKDRLRTMLTIAQRKHAELLERSAKQTGSWTTFVACGDAYAQIFNQPTRDARIMDEVLYNAGVCYESGRAVDKAIGVYQQLRAGFPQSRLVPRALVRLASIYAAVANFPKAAEKLEMYARQHSGEKDAFDAMSDAYYYRSHTGEDAKAIADAQFLIKNYGNKRRDQIADVKFALTAIYEKRGDKVAALANLQAYVAQSRLAPNRPENHIAAYAKIGEILWTQSCPFKTTDGACVKVLPVSRTVSCESRRTKQPRPRYTLVARDPKKVKQAMAAFAAARQLFDRLQTISRSSDDLAASTTARYFNALARRIAAEPAFEQLITTQFPAGLNFDAANPQLAKQAQHRFDAWLRLVTAGKQNLRVTYQDIFALKDPIATIAVAARLGQIDDHLANALQGGDIPAAFRAGPYGEEKVTALCEVMAAEAAPFQTSAQQAFDMCATKARELSLHNEWTTLCNRELNRIDPTLAPPQRELQAAPSAMESVVATEPPQPAPPASSNPAPAATPAP